jgi:hypothetical protein
LTPVFDGREWWTTEYDIKDLYSSYPTNSDTEIMVDITVSKNPSNNKYVIRSYRALKISRLAWQNNNDNAVSSFHGFGLEKDSKGSVIPFSGNWGDVIIYGGHYGEYEEGSTKDLSINNYYDNIL